MIKLFSTTALLVVISTAAIAQTATVNHSIPSNSFTVTDWYKQSVYDPKDNKIGEITDVLVDKSGVLPL